MEQRENFLRDIDAVERYLETIVGGAGDQMSLPGMLGEVRERKLLPEETVSDMMKILEVRNRVAGGETVENALTGEYVGAMRRVKEKCGV